MNRNLCNTCRRWYKSIKWEKKFAQAQLDQEPKEACKKCRQGLVSFWHGYTKKRLKGLL